MRLSADADFDFATGCALVRYIVSTYFINLRSVLISYDSANVSTTREGYLSCVKSSFQFNVETSVVWMDFANLSQVEVNAKFLQNIELGMEGHITILPENDEFLQTRYYATERSVTRLKDRFMLFLTDGESPDCLLRNEILQFYPYHLMALPVRSRNLSTFELWTQKFTTSDRNLEAIHLDTFNSKQSFERSAELYPNKVSDMEGRIIRIGSITYVPYVISNFVKPGEGSLDSVFGDMARKNVLYEGSEAALIMNFCELRNCTLQVCPFGPNEWGGVSKNGSSDGMIGAVFKREVEFGIGCYYNWYNDLFETSAVVAKSAVRLMGPAPMMYASYMTNILPFSPHLWYSLILTLIVASLTMHLIKFGYRVRDSFTQTILEILAIFLQQSFSQTKLVSFASRFFLVTLFLAGITLENTYSGQLKSLLTIPLFTEPIDTVKQFAATNWKWGAPAEAWVLTISKSDLSFEQEVTRKFEIRETEVLSNLSFSGRYALPVERLHSGLYSFGDYIQDRGLDKLILFKDDLFFDWTRGFAVRGWPLMNEFNIYVLWCSAHGLFEYWEEKYVFKYLDRVTQQRLSLAAKGDFTKPPPTALTVANISGPLFALLIGCSLATFVFFLEILLRKIQKKCPWRKL